MGLWKLIRRVDTKRMRTTCAQVAREARRPRPVIFCDMVWCGFRYRAGYLDYALFRFWELSGVQRASVLTRGKNDQYVAALNDRAEWDAFEVKPEFLARFAPYVKRRWLDLTAAGPEELRAFGEDLGAFIVKPRDASHGDDVEKLRADQVEDWSALHARLHQHGPDGHHSEGGPGPRGGGLPPGRQRPPAGGQFQQRRHGGPGGPGDRRDPLPGPGQGGKSL